MQAKSTSVHAWHYNESPHASRATTLTLYMQMNIYITGTNRHKVRNYLYNICSQTAQIIKNMSNDNASKFIKFLTKLQFFVCVNFV